jgi:iron(III) transport system permease protein
MTAVPDRSGATLTPAHLAQSAPRPDAPGRLRRWWMEQYGPVALVLILLLALLVLPPLWLLIDSSAREVYPDGTTGPWSLVNYIYLLTGGTLLSSTANSVIFSIGATIVSLAFGGSLAWLVERTDAPLKALGSLTAIISLGTPYILYVNAWLFLLGKAGPFIDFYRQMTGTIDTPFEVHSLWGMILIEGFAWSPLVFLLLAPTFRAANGEMEEAARMSGASVFDTIWQISMRLAMPAILALAMFVFIRNLEAFEVPALTGLPGHVELLTTDIYLSLELVPPQVGHASAFATVMLILVSGLFLLYGRISRGAGKYQSITGKGYRPVPFKLGRGRWIGGALIVFNFLVLEALPLASLLWNSLLPFARPMRTAALKLLSLNNYVHVLQNPFYLGLVLNTLIVAAGAATIAVLITLFTGWLAARRRPGSVLLDQLTTLPLIFPGLVLGVALMQEFLRLPVPIYGTVWAIMLGYVIRYMPYSMRASYSGVLQIHSDLEEAARISGATALVTLRKIVAPLLSPALISAWLFIFLVSAREMSMALLLASNASQTIAVGMYDRLTNGQAGEVSALGLMWTLFMTGCSTATYVFMRRNSTHTFGH